MFNSKKKTLFQVKQQPTSAIPTQPFIRKGLEKAVTTTSLGNGAVKLTTTSNDFVDQFGKAAQYKAPRSFEEISKDQSLLFSQNKFMAIAMIIYLRMITRIVALFTGGKTSEVQRGQGLKHEGIFRMIWLHINAPDLFWKNIALFISVGSWKDVFVMLSYDLVYNGWEGRKLDWENFGKLLLAGLENPSHSELIKKYLPQIKANSACKTVEAQADNIIAKWICSLLFGSKQSASSYKNYRKLKSGGTAHQWQQLISQGKHKLVDFDTIHGRALSQLVSSKYLKNQGLEAKYQEWISKKPIAKYTGYVYELFTTLSSNSTKYQKDTINKQFMGLVETAKQNILPNNKLLAIIDTSNSMTAKVPGTNVSAYTVAKAMALFFSYMLEGIFKDVFFEFTDNTRMKRWKGDSPVDQFLNERSSIIGSTNFQSVAAELVSIRKSGVSEQDFPGGIICISDGCFNSAGPNKTNTVAFKEKLLAGGFSPSFVNDFKIILWAIPNNYYGKAQTAFEGFADTPNLFHISGLDPAGIAFITGTTKNAPATSSEDMLNIALNQEIMQLIQL
jgi:hypothetical protein